MAFLQLPMYLAILCDLFGMVKTPTSQTSTPSIPRSYRRVCHRQTSSRASAGGNTAICSAALLTQAEPVDHHLSDQKRVVICYI